MREARKEVSDHPSFRHVASFLDATRGPSIEASKVSGALLGLGVGNALGIPFEGQSRDWIQTAPADRLREIGAWEKDELWDDDTAQTVILAEAFLDKGHLDRQDVAERLLEWRNQNGRGIGLLTAEVLGKLTTGMAPWEAAQAAWENSGQQAAGNGAVMRCAPVALACWASGERLVDQAIESSLVTHFDPRCVATVVALTAVIAVCLTGFEPDLEQLAKALERDGSPLEVAEATKHVPLSALDLDNPRAMGYTIKAYQVGLWSLTQSKFEDSLVAVVSEGGDTDTNGAVAGAVMGARLGIEAIPSRWIESLHDPAGLKDLSERLTRRFG
ncbi:MAG TPA: ADP-ribosylglycohydrolase family protein [Actinomycetota bacterium]|nr:ADP-ribosylglycohydrolase family protein [Actinomycetota bacterium]